jgi:chromosome segregation ATPase
MKNPGMCIPTPAVIKRETPGGYHSEDLSGLGMVFSRPLRTAMESPLAKTNTSSDAAPPLPALVDQREQQHPVSGSNDDDDDAFLPDDFKKPEQTYTWAQVQQFVEQAKADSRDKQKHLENEIDDLNQKFEQHLKQQGLLWKQEKEAEYSRLNQMLKEEKNKTAQTLNEMTAKLNHCETDREFLLLRVSELEAAALSDPHKRDAAAKDTTIVELNRQLLILEKELDELREAQVVESNHEELIILKGEKTAAERQVFDLSERLRIRTESNNEALKRLEDAENEISFLKQQMSVPAAGEELDNAKAEIEQLKSLRAKDEQEMEGLRTQMKRVNEQYQAVLYTPKKRNGNNAPESPCSEVDILQVDNDKLHEQLKAMGNVRKKSMLLCMVHFFVVLWITCHLSTFCCNLQILKRYKLERDEFKARMDHMEKSHVEAIEIAVKHATEQWKNKNTELSKQVEAIDKMTESTKAVQLEELKSQFKQEKEELLAGHKEEISRYENEIQLIRSKSHEETDKLKQELEMEKDKAIKAKTLECEKLEKQILAMSEMHEEEIELVKSEFNDEIHRLQSELSSGSSREAQEEPVSKIKSQLQEVIDDLQTKLDTTTLEKNDLANKVKTLESSLAKVQAVADNAINEKDLLKRDMENRHQQLVDDLTAELDLVEAENSERVRKLQDDLKAKDTVIAAMGSQLADYESRFTKVGESQESLRKEVETLREEVQKAQVEADAKRQEIARINEEHQRAIDEAVDEVATKAEKQFEERNQRWRVLKSNFDEQTSKISVLERDLRLANKERDELQRTHEAREADLKDELAQARAGKRPSISIARGTTLYEFVILTLLLFALHCIFLQLLRRLRQIWLGSRKIT